MTGNSSKPLSKCLGIAVGTTWADLGTAPNGIPCRVGPLDTGMVAHLRCVPQKMHLTFRRTTHTESNLIHQQAQRSTVRWSRGTLRVMDEDDKIMNGRPRCRGDRLG